MDWRKSGKDLFCKHGPASRSVPILGVLLLLSAIFATAQNPSTSLRGTISDPSGAVIATLKSRWSTVRTASPRTALPTPAAPISFPQLPPGNYTIAVDAVGFSQQSKSIELLINQPATLNFSLPVEAAPTTVSVSGQAPDLNSTDATMGNAFDSATILALPVEGDIPDLLSLQPGVLYLGLHNDQSHDSRSGSTAGARSDQNNSTLDGLDNNDQVRGYAFTGVLRSTLDSVQEFRVSTAGFNADTGRSSGAQINIATKSGTNDFHGSVYGRTREPDHSCQRLVQQAGRAGARLAQHIPAHSIATPMAPRSAARSRRTSCSSSPPMKARKSTKTSR